MIEKADEGRWVHVQSTTDSSELETSLPRPGQKGSKLLGHIACMEPGGDKDQVLVQPIDKTIEGLAKCLESLKGSGAFYTKG